MFEDHYPERTKPQEAADRYRDVPLGVEAAWPGSVSDERVQERVADSGN